MALWRFATRKKGYLTTKLIEDTLESRLLAKKGALALRGKLSFCDALVFGRLGRIALQEITHHAYAQPFVAKLGQRLVESLELLKSRVLTGAPRSLSCRMLETFFLFTDASFSLESGAGFGAVLLTGKGKVISWFAMHVGTADVSQFLAEGCKTVIGELETLVVAISLLLWGDGIRSSQLMIYIDNEGAKFSLVKGYSDARAITAICALTATALDKFVILPWYRRVPSSSNIADFPSRNVPHRILQKETQSESGCADHVSRELEISSRVWLATKTWVGSVANKGGYGSSPMNR